MLTVLLIYKGHAHLHQDYSKNITDENNCSKKRFHVYSHMSSLKCIKWFGIAKKNYWLGINLHPEKKAFTVCLHSKISVLFEWHPKGPIVETVSFQTRPHLPILTIHDQPNKA